ncbi:MAG: ABC transporter permease [Planctomycetota bacterium]
MMSSLLTLPLLLGQSVASALGQIWANKVRATLTTLGIIIGVASVIAVIGGLQGMRGYVLKEFEQLGARKMWVWGTVPDELRNTLNYADVRVHVGEARLLGEHAPSVETLTPMTQLGGDVRSASVTKTGVDVRGVWPAWHDIEDRQVVRGRPITDGDVDNRLQVCVINDKAIDELRLSSDPVGGFLLVNGRRFLIVGVVETKDEPGIFGGGESESELIIPFSTHKMMNPYTGTWFMTRLTEPTSERTMDEVSADAQAETRFIMRKNRGLGADDEDTFDMAVLQSAIQQFNQVAGVITAGAGAVVSISLLVGGIGIMNIMLVSVSERTREIGLRKALGAPPWLVLVQFLVEAVVLCMVGGLIGIAIGQGLVEASKRIPNFPLEHAGVPGWAIVLALAFSAGVGVIFGMLPAIKAAQLNPIDALRHE